MARRYSNEDQPAFEDSSTSTGIANTVPVLEQFGAQLGQLRASAQSDTANQLKYSVMNREQDRLERKDYNEFVLNLMDKETNKRKGELDQYMAMQRNIAEMTRDNMQAQTLSMQLQMTQAQFKQNMGYQNAYNTLQPHIAQVTAAYASDPVRGAAMERQLKEDPVLGPLIYQMDPAQSSVILNQWKGVTDKIQLPHPDGTVMTVGDGVATLKNGNPSDQAKVLASLAAAGHYTVDAAAAMYGVKDLSVITMADKVMSRAGGSVGMYKYAAAQAALTKAGADSLPAIAAAWDDKNGPLDTQALSRMSYSDFDQKIDRRNPQDVQDAARAAFRNFKGAAKVTRLTTDKSQADRMNADLGVNVTEWDELLQPLDLAKRLRSSVAPENLAKFDAAMTQAAAAQIQTLRERTPVGKDGRDGYAINSDNVSDLGDALHAAYQYVPGMENQTPDTKDMVPTRMLANMATPIELTLKSIRGRDGLGGLTDKQKAAVAASGQQLVLDAGGTIKGVGSNKQAVEGSDVTAMLVHDFPIKTDRRMQSQLGSLLLSTMISPVAPLAVGAAVSDIAGRPSAATYVTDTAGVYAKVVHSMENKNARPEAARARAKAAVDIIDLQNYITSAGLTPEQAKEADKGKYNRFWQGEGTFQKVGAQIPGYVSKIAQDMAIFAKTGSESNLQSAQRELDMLNADPTVDKAGLKGRFTLAHFAPDDYYLSSYYRDSDPEKGLTEWFHSINNAVPLPQYEQTARPAPIMSGAAEATPTAAPGVTPTAAPARTVITLTPPPGSRLKPKQAYADDAAVNYWVKEGWTKQ